MESKNEAVSSYRTYYILYTTIEQIHDANAEMRNIFSYSGFSFFLYFREDICYTVDTKKGEVGL